jgi:hypothetical protein
VPRITPARLATEASGLLIAAAFAMVALGHALAGAKRSLLLDDGDSVLLPLIVRSAHEGLPVEWGMSPVLFVFPELPLYALSAAVTTTVSAALLLNGVLNVVLLYLLLRFVAARVVRPSDPEHHRSSVSRAAPVTAALVGVAVFTALCLVETRPGGNTGEIASLYLTTTYYAGTVMATVAATGLVVLIVSPSTLVAGADATTPGRRMHGAALTLVLLSALATLSNPLYVLWVTAPAALAAVVVAVVRRRFRRPSWAVGALVVGSGVGYAARMPLSRFLIADRSEYFRWDPSLSTRFFEGVLRDLVATPGGVGELVVGVLMILLAIAVVVARLRRDRDDDVAVVALMAVTTVAVVPVALIVTGSISTRYALPMLFAPLVVLVAVVASRLDGVRDERAADGPRQGSGARVEPAARRRRTDRVAGVIGVAVLVATGALAVPSSATVITAGRALGDPAARCLTDWARGKGVAGAAQFWLGRGLQAYGGADVHLLQVRSDLTVYPWLTNLAAYRGARVGYVLVPTGEIPGGHVEGWGDSVNELGRPRQIVACDGFDIVDFRGTPGEKRLTDVVVGSAEVQAALRGFGW